MSELFEPIAVIGMAVRLPGARDHHEFWENLRAGRDCVTDLSEQQLLAVGVPASRIADPAYVRAAGLIPDIELFDAAHFAMSPGDAQMCDPQLRLLLELTHEAIEDAGYAANGVGRDVAVFAASGPSRYATVNLLPHPDFAGGMDVGISVLNNIDYLATLVSYKFDFRGPSMAVLTACSSSLTAVHLACQSLQLGECDLAVAGACNVELPYGTGYRWGPGDVRSPDGHCRPFDATASGTIFTNGAGTVLLKRLDDAIVAGDHVRGVIRGIGINNDGSDKVSFSAPSVTGQAGAVVDAMNLAGVGPASVSFVEMHATGTALGDPIEVAALRTAYQHLAGDALAPGSIPVGSVKSNVGHATAAAGMAGLVKLLLALEHEQLPPTANLTVLNPRLELEHTPFTVLDALRPWPRTTGGLRRAGLSSLGIGGTNVHLVLDEGPPPVLNPPAGRRRVVVWSARDEPAEHAARARLSAHFDRTGDPLFADTVSTLQGGRRAYPVRGALVCGSAAEAAARLAGDLPVIAGKVDGGAPRVGFAFARDEQARRHTAAGLYGVQRRFTETVDVCLELFAGHDLDLYPAWLDDAPDEPFGAPQGRCLLFAVQYALACQWREWGVAPIALFGTGVGELVALTVSGVLDLPDAVRMTALGTSAEVAGAVDPTVPVWPAVSHGCALDVVIEVGPGAADPHGSPPTLSSLGGSDEPDDAALMTALATMWTMGAEVEWSRVYLDEPRQRVPAPGYAFQRRRLWVDVRPGSAAPAAAAEPPRAAADPGAQPLTPFALPGWAESDAPAADPAGSLVGKSCLALLPVDRAAARWTFDALCATGMRVVPVVAGAEFASAGDRFTVRPERLADDLQAVLAELRTGAGAPDVVVHAWASTEPAGPPTDNGEPQLERTFFALLDLVRSAARHPVEGRLPAVLVLTCGAADVSGAEPLDPAHASMIAAVRSFALESAGQRCRLVDCTAAVDAECVAAELAADADEVVVALRGRRRWVQRNRPLQIAPGRLPVVRPGGTYVITGGLGGLGSTLAEALAATGLAPRIALLGRSGATQAADQLLARLAAGGAAAHVIGCDVAEEAQLERALVEVTDRFGPISGVFHLAGVPGQAMLQFLTRPEATRVLRPKVLGSVALARCLRRRPRADFVVCFSSQAALSGMVGGADYAAANAFVDAFAAAEPGWTSINWPVWADVGMAADGRVDALAERLRALGGSAGAELGGDDELWEEAVLSTASSWVLDEHRIRGVAVLPGTAIVDLVIGALLRLGGGALPPVVLRDLVFRHPMIGNEPRTVRVGVRSGPDGSRQARVRSRPVGEAGPWQLHASCSVASARSARRTVDVEQLRNRAVEVERPRSRPGGVFKFGPRWQGHARMWQAGDSALVELALPTPYLDEVSEHPVHPALLDISLGILGGSVGDGFFAPSSYGVLTWYGPLPPRLHTHLRIRHRSTDSLVFDAELVAPDGVVAVAVESVVMRRVDAAGFTAGKATHAAVGLAPAEGIRLLSMILGAGLSNRVAVLPHHAGTPITADVGRAGVANPAAPAPAPPAATTRAATEQALRGIWVAVLGRADVRAESDFFDLGGDSLVAVAVAARIRDTFGVELGAGALFDFPTLAELTDVLIAQLDDSAGAPVNG